MEPEPGNTAILVTTLIVLGILILAKFITEFWSITHLLNPP